MVVQSRTRFRVRKLFDDARDGNAAAGASMRGTTSLLSDEASYIMRDSGARGCC